MPEAPPDATPELVMAGARLAATAANVVSAEHSLHRPSEDSTADERPPRVLPDERGLRERREGGPPER